MDIESGLRLIAPKKQCFRLGKILPAPQYSACMYVRIAPRDVAMFKFFLEAEDNLGYMSVVDRWRAVLKVVFSPHQEKEIRAWLKAAAETLEFEEIWLNQKNDQETGTEQNIKAQLIVISKNNGV